MDIGHSVALVTGANRGIGEAFVEALLDAGASRVYAAARDADSLTDLVARDPARIVPLALDITDPAQVQAAAERAADVTLLINNAGTAQFVGFLAAPDLDAALAAVADGVEDVFPDPMSAEMHANLLQDAKAVERQAAEFS